MNIKKIRSYLAILLIIVAGIFSLWNSLNTDQLEKAERPGDLSQAEEDSASENLPEVGEPTSTQLIDESKLVDETSIEGYNDIHSIEYLNNMPEHVQVSYTLYKEDGWEGTHEGQTPGTKAGGHFGNYDSQLPEYDGSDAVISYKEFDVNNKIEGQSRDAERFVVGSDGSVYYTDDHYDSYVKIIE